MAVTSALCNANAVLMLLEMCQQVPMGQQRGLLYFLVQYTKQLYSGFTVTLSQQKLKKLITSQLLCSLFIFHCHLFFREKMDALNKGMSHQIHTMQNSNTETCNCGRTQMRNIQVRV